jgi:hypothetical protein
MQIPVRQYLIPQPRLPPGATTAHSDLRMNPLRREIPAAEPKDKARNNR